MKMMKKVNSFHLVSNTAVLRELKYVYLYYIFLPTIFEYLVSISLLLLGIIIMTGSDKVHMETTW